MSSSNAADENLAPNATIGDPRQPFKLGLFGSNASRGLITSNEPGTLELTWERTKAIAQLADSVGFDLLLPFARWRGYGGKADMNATVYEPFTWAAGLAAVTENITVATTVHASAIHPVVAAKMAVTVNHQSSGRFAVNLVMGWFPLEQQLFGSDPLAHDERYSYGDEWLSIVKLLWTETEPFDFHGKHFNVVEGQAKPKPFDGVAPAIINAGSSPAGIDFSARQADINFCSIFSIESGREHVENIKKLAAANSGREISVMTYGTVFCADTEEEAQARYDSVIANADWESANKVMDTMGVTSQSYGDQLQFAKERFITSGGGYPLVGNPEQVAAQLVEISKIGIDGMIFGFVDYEAGVSYFAERVLPLLKQAGLRV
jgi:FMNH2-dependent dimethyl sulfone monooxygenase